MIYEMNQLQFNNLKSESKNMPGLTIREKIVNYINQVYLKKDLITEVRIHSREGYQWKKN